MGCQARTTQQLDSGEGENIVTIIRSLDLYLYFMNSVNIFIGSLDGAIDIDLNRSVWSLAFLCC